LNDYSQEYSVEHYEKNSRDKSIRLKYSQKHCPTLAPSAAAFDEAQLLSLSAQKTDIESKRKIPKTTAVLFIMKKRFKNYAA
jgi:hypothetical protein